MLEMEHDVRVSPAEHRRTIGRGTARMWLPPRQPRPAPRLTSHIQRRGTGPALLGRPLPQPQLAQRAVDPEPRQLFLHAVLAEPGAQAVEVDVVEVLVLVEAGEHHAL